MSTKKYTDSQIMKFHKDYEALEICPITKFAREHKLSIAALRRGFVRLGLKVLPLEVVKRKYPVNDNFFEDIDTEEKAYYLGLLFADGCNHSGRVNKIELSLAKQDVYILERLSQLLL